jgi:hypothetical protein
MLKEITIRGFDVELIQNDTLDITTRGGKPTFLSNLEDPPIIEFSDLGIEFDGRFRLKIIELTYSPNTVPHYYQTGNVFVVDVEPTDSKNKFRRLGSVECIMDCVQKGWIDKAGELLPDND